MNKAITVGDIIECLKNHPKDEVLLGKLKGDTNAHPILINNSETIELKDYKEVSFTFLGKVIG